MRERTQAASSSAWSLRLALFSAGLVVVTGLFHRLFGMATPVALNLFAVAFVLSGMSILVAIFALVRIWQRGYAGTAGAMAGLIIAGLVLSWPLSLVPKLRALPTINDVTTDPQNPPPFIFLAAERPAGANTTAYPGETVAGLRKAAYPDLQPLLLRRPVQDVFDLVRSALRRLRMQTVNEIPYGSEGRRWGLIEATDRTLVLGFLDDVAVRVQPVEGGTRVDVRSASRYGRHDLGRNAERIRSVLNEIVARADATVPRQGRRSERSRGPRSQ